MDLNVDQKKFIEQVAVENGFKNFEIISKPGSSKGDNFLGIIVSIIIRSDEKSLSLILKSAPTSEALRKMQPTRALFLREEHMYKNVFTEFAKYQEEYNIPNPFNAYPKIYGMSDKDFSEHIIMEDLRQEGYKMCNKKLTMNVDHAKAVLGEYAKYHAVSLVMNNKSPERFEKIVKDVKNDVLDFGTLDSPLVIQYIDSCMNNAYKVVEDDIKATEVLKKYHKDIMNFLGHDINSKDNLVITHGDSWCNNLLFKYEDCDSKKPSLVRIVDWQLAKFSSPGFDLANFLFANTSKEVLNDYKTLLHHYHDVASELIKAFGCDSEEIYPYDLVEKQFIKQTKNALFQNLQVLRMTLCEADETPDFEEMAKREMNISDFSNFSVANLDLYNERILGVIKFMMDNNFF